MSEIDGYDQSAGTKSKYIALIGILFFVFGFTTWLNGSLIPFFKVICKLTNAEAFFVTFAFYISYTLLALPMASILARTGYRNGMAIGLGLMALGCLIFVPAALSAQYLVFLVGLFTIGAGLTILQTASNPYIVLLGPNDSAAARISVMGIINKSAGFLAPLAFSSIVLAKMPTINAQISTEVLHEMASKLIGPYVAMALVLSGLVVFVLKSGLPNIGTDEDDSDSTVMEILKTHPKVLFGAITLFGYIGVEVIAGDTIGLFGHEIGVADYTRLTSFTMAFMVLGYILGIALIPRLVSARSALVASGLFGLLCVIGALTSSAASSSISEILWGWSGIRLLPDPITWVALMGLANALVWPSLWPIVLHGLGKATAKASAILIMSISGGAILPLLFGRIGDQTHDTALGYLVAIPAYLLIAVFAFWANPRKALHGR